MTKESLAHAFPIFQEPALLDQIWEKGREMNLSPGDELMRPGSYIKAIPLLVEGRIRISRQDGEGGEVLLYFLSGSQTCAMSLSCCMADQKSSVLAIVEEQTQLLMIPVAYLDQWMTQFPSWKAFIMQTYAMRFNELLKAFDAVAFLRMDERLIQYLAGRRKAEGTHILQLSHQDIAQELHTSREVISRLLKRLEHDGQLKLGRNRIELSQTARWLPT